MNIFNFFKKKNGTDIPKFTYIDDYRFVCNTVSFAKKCNCCGIKTNIIYTNGIYSEENVDILCPRCIINGEASKKFKGSFNDVELSDSIDNEQAKEELEKRTPTLNTWQEVRWVACCNDYCRFIKFLSLEDFENQEVLLSIQQTYKEDEGVPFEQLRVLCEESGANILLFQCLICKKYYIRVDLN